MIALEREIRNNSFVQKVVQGEVSDFNILSSYPYHPESLNVLYGHADFTHLKIVLEELEKIIVVPWRVLQRHSVYTWDCGWIPSANTKIELFEGKQIAIENGYSINFLPSKKQIPQLIQFLTSRCWSKEANCLEASWDCPYIATDFEYKAFTSCKEIVSRSAQRLITSCYVPNNFVSDFGIEQECFLFEPFAEFINATQKSRNRYEFITR